MQKFSPTNISCYTVFSPVQTKECSKSCHFQVFSSATILCPDNGRSAGFINFRTNGLTSIALEAADTKVPTCICIALLLNCSIRLVCVIMKRQQVVVCGIFTTDHITLNYTVEKGLWCALECVHLH